MINNELIVIVIILLMYISLQLTIKNNNQIKDKSNYEISSDGVNAIHQKLVRKIYEENPAKIPVNIPVHIPVNMPIEIPFNDQKRIPINISTRGESETYRQIGVLNNGDNSKILSLFGKATWRGSSKFLYYTQTDRFVSVNLPVYKNNKNCSHEYGCDELFDQDIVTVPQLNEEFVVTIYPINSPTYIPFI